MEITFKYECLCFCSENWAVCLLVVNYMTHRYCFISLWIITVAGKYSKTHSFPLTCTNMFSMGLKHVERLPLKYWFCCLDLYAESLLWEPSILDWSFQVTFGDIYSGTSLVSLKKDSLFQRIRPKYHRGPYMNKISHSITFL